MPSPDRHFANAAIFTQSTGVTPNSGDAALYIKTDNKLYIKDSTGTEAAAGIGGSTGATDNAILRADGTGAATLQNSDLNVEDASTATQNNVAITNQHSGQTNSALVLTPKGTGAFIVGPKPDGTSTGGNARGANAIEIYSTGRTNADQVAGGARSILIGRGRIGSGGSDSIAIGTGTLVASNDAIQIGSNSTGDAFGVGQSSVAIGVGINCTAQSAIAIGNSASSTVNTAIAMGNPGGGQTITASIRGQFIVPAFSSLWWGGTTTNATATILNTGISATNRFTIAASTALAVDILVVARSVSIGKYLVAKRYLAIRRDGSNGTALIGTVETIGTDKTEGSPTWTFALTADDTNEALQLEVTGAASETVEWRATAFYRVV